MPENDNLTLDDELLQTLNELGITTRRLDELTHGRHLVFEYGPTGAGKTYGAYQLLKAFGRDKVGFINYEKGELTVEGSQLISLEIHDPASLSTGLAKISQAKIQGKIPLDYIVLDSAAEFFEDLLEENTAEAAAKNIKEDPLVASQRSYLKTKARTRKLMKWLKDAPFHMIFTSQDQVETDANGVRQVVPTLSPSIITTYFRAVDAIIYIHPNQNGQRAFLTRPLSNIHAKCRTPIGRPPLPPVIYGSKNSFDPTNPDLADLFRYYNGEEIEWITEPKS